MSYFSQAGESSLREYQTKSVLILGVGGIAMSQVALLLKSQGFEVLGFDTVIYPPASDILCKAQIKILSNIGEITWQDIGFVVIGNSITRNHPTLPFVEALRIPYCCMPKIIKDFLLDKSQRIVVTGTHGKSTTSALIVHFLTELGLSPSFMVGAVSRSGSSMLQQGVSDIAVVEGDEYDSSFYAKISKFYYYNPSVIVVTALDYDHKDVFPTEESYIDNFRRFLLGLDNATFIIHQKPLLKLGISTTDLKGSVIIYPSSDFSFRVCKQDRDALKIKTQLELNIHQETYQLSTNLIGSHNFENILAASIATYVATGKICSSLENFEGLKRRLELRAKSSRFILIDDFAHHPSEVAAGLEALKSNYQGWNLCVFFEPRSNTS
ncbi:MAG: Mur ligase family protein, partial [Deltaproteobacteria bacterium]|nr:Mur ligase family protein [Deltaproteobacteria bacterium]